MPTPTVNGVLGSASGLFGGGHLDGAAPRDVHHNAGGLQHLAATAAAAGTRSAVVRVRGQATATAPSVNDSRGAVAVHRIIVGEKIVGTAADGGNEEER